MEFTKRKIFALNLSKWENTFNSGALYERLTSVLIVSSSTISQRSKVLLHVKLTVRLLYTLGKAFRSSEKHPFSQKHLDVTCASRKRDELGRAWARWGETRVYPNDRQFPQQLTWPVVAAAASSRSVRSSHFDPRALAAIICLTIGADNDVWYNDLRSACREIKRRE